MVSEFMSTFHRFLSSNAEMPLDNSFEVYFHVASAKYVSRPTNRRKAIPLRSQVGGNDPTTKSLLPGSLINIPPGSPSNPDCFKNSCLLVSLAYLIIQLKKPEVFKQVKSIVLQKSTVREKNVAATLLLEEMELICSRQKISVKGPHDIFSTIQAFHQMYQVQTVVVMSMSGRKPELTMFPEAFDFTIPRLYIFVDRQNDHALIIQSLSTFFATKKKGICFFCLSYYYCNFGKAHKAKHKCRNSSCCQNCFSVFEGPDFIKNDSEPWLYCDSKTAQTSSNIVCCKCGFNFDTQICYNNHMKFCDVGNYFWKCVVCQKSVSMQGRDIKSIEETHLCDIDEKFCTVCLKYLPKHHICAISKASKTSIWPNVGVLQMIFQDINGSLCQVCYRLQLDYMDLHNLTYKEMLEAKDTCNLSCENHKTKKCSTPNIIKICYEYDRFQFQCQTFSDKSFLCPTVPLNETLNLSYCNDPVSFTNFSSRKRKRKGNQDQRKIVGPETAVKHFLNFFIEKNIRNLVFLVQSNQEMLYLLEIFLENFWHPSVVQSGRVIKKIDLSDLDLSFILFENYCKGSLSDWLQQFEIERTVFYFPTAFNDPKYYGQTIPKPEFCHFQSFTDTSDEFVKKLKFYKTVDSTISVNLFLYQCVSENLKSFLLCVLKFVQLCFELQAIFQNVTNSLESKPIHPFASKTCSISSFAMQVLKYFYLNQYDIKSVLHAYTGFPAKVSGPEHEYFTFLSYTKPEEDIKHAFNSITGQQRFKHILVDGYSDVTKTTYQFYGCQVSVMFC